MAEKRTTKRKKHQGEPVSYLMRLDPQTYDAVKLLAFASGQSMNSTLNEAAASYTSSPQAQQTLASFIEDLNEERSSDEQQDARRPRRRAGKRSQEEGQEAPQEG